MPRIIRIVVRLRTEPAALAMEASDATTNGLFEVGATVGVDVEGTRVGERVLGALVGLFDGVKEG